MATLEHNIEKTKTYTVKALKNREQKGKKISGAVRFLEDGGVYNSGDTIELTPTRMKAIGADYFEEVKESK